jgi:hypothetical protein
MKLSEKAVGLLPVLFGCCVGVVPLSPAGAQTVGASEYYKFVSLKCETAASMAAVAQDLVNNGQTDLKVFMGGFDDAVKRHLGNLSASDRDTAEAVGTVVTRAKVKASPDKAKQVIRESCRAHPENFAIYP